ncbi:MAG: LamG domain-containing protein, partial [Sedimentisphaerales bacterium]
MARIVKITAIVGLLALCGSAWAVDSNGLVAHWKLDEGSGGTAYDSANSNDGTLVNGPAWTSGKIGGALGFDGENDYVVVGDDSSLDIAGAISFSAWIKLNNVNWQIIISKRGPGGGYPYGGYTFHFQDRAWNTGGAYRLLFTKTNGIAGSGGGNYGTHTHWDRVASEKDDWQTGVWYHVAATWDGTTNTDSMKMYIDGQLDATHTAKQSFILTNNYDVTIGDILPQLTNPFNGLIDDVRIYERVLSAGEVEELYLMEMSAHERAIMKLEDAAGKKQAALETIEEALDEEWDAYG